MPGTDTRRIRPVGTVVVVPVKRFEMAKTRLASAVGPAQRAEIARRLAERVIDAVRSAGYPMVVVTSDPDARLLAAEAGGRIVPDPDPPDLNAAVAAGIAEAERLGGKSVLVLPADLPHLTPEDVSAAAERPTGGAAISPSRGGEGTNALCMPIPPPIEPSYGPESFRRHIALLEAAGIPVKVVRRPGLEVDADLPGDLST